MAAYNFKVAKDASSISAEISSDAFDRNPILNNANEAIESTFTCTAINIVFLLPVQKV